jgi:Protein of unknown function, DUF547
LYFLFAALCAAGSITDPVEAAPDADLWERWHEHNPRATPSIDHGEWDRLVKTYVSKSPDGVNRVNYAGVTAADRRTLTDYIAKLEAIPISKYDRRAQFAYWVNLYNAITLEVVLDHYPVESILDIRISPGLFADGPWDQKLIEVEAQAISLNESSTAFCDPYGENLVFITR